ncbi:MAG: peptidylprolyl isomerase, partial [bacterium]
QFNTEIKIAHILTSSPDTARALLTRLKEGARFSALAKKYSLDPSGDAGGVTDYIRRGDMASAPELEDAAFALDKPGQLSGVVQSGYGYHIVKLISRRRLPKPAKLEDISDQIRDGLLIKKQKEVFENLIAELRTKTNVEVHPELLSPYSPAPRREPEGN